MLKKGKKNNINANKWIVLLAVLVAVSLVVDLLALNVLYGIGGTIKLRGSLATYDYKYLPYSSTYSDMTYDECIEPYLEKLQRAVNGWNYYKKAYDSELEHYSSINEMVSTENYESDPATASQVLSEAYQSLVEAEEDLNNADIMLDNAYDEYSNGHDYCSKYLNYA